MFIPFLAAASIAAVFANMGAMAVKISVLTVAFNSTIALCIALIALSVWLAKRR